MSVLPRILLHRRLGGLRLLHPDLLAPLAGLAAAAAAAPLLGWSRCSPAAAAVGVAALLVMLLLASRVGGGLEARLHGWPGAVAGLVVDRVGFERLSVAAGVTVSRLELVSRLARLLRLASLSAAAAAPPLAAVAGCAAAALPVLPPLLLYLGVAAYAAGRAAERGKLAGEELPFLALWAWLLERSGLGGVEEALALASRSGLLRGFAVDAGRRLEELARLHPSREARRLFSYYLAVRSAGGDTAALLEDYVRSAGDELRLRMEGYGEAGLSVGTLFIGGVAAAPLVAVFLAALGGSPALPLAAALPAAVAGYLVLHQLQPRLRESWGGDARGAAAAAVSAAAAAAVAAAAGLPAALAAAAAAAGGLAGYGLVYASWRRRVEAEEKLLPPLLRIVIEAARARSLPLQRLLEEAAGSIEQPLRSAVLAAARTGRVEAESWLARYTLYTLSEVAARRGALDPVAMERLHDLVYSYTTARRLAASRLRPLALLPLGVPPLAVVAAALLAKIAGELAEQPLPLAIAAPDTVAAAAAAAAAGAAAGLLYAKAASLTVRAALPAAAAAAAAVLAALLSPLAGLLVP